MKVTFLGTGTSQGVPVIACSCPVCISSDPFDKRLRVSVLIETGGKSLLIDCGPDFRYQMLRAGVKHLDAILFTHEHKDHVAGLDDVRAFNYRTQQAIDVYAHTRVQKAIKREFEYIFSDFKYPGIPQVNLHEVTGEPLSVMGIAIQPIEVMHFLLPVYGFRIGDFTYITDAKTVPAASKDKIRGTKVLVINALQKESHISHFTLQEALDFATEINAEKTYLTHISHRMGKHQDIAADLPGAVELAFDGLVLEI
ncbi:MAG TPA: MBL fold metallo-hydrolase [Sphingobacteriaceae bacterium]